MFCETLSGEVEILTASFIWFKFTGGLPVAACCREPNNDPAMLKKLVKSEIYQQE